MSRSIKGTPECNLAAERWRKTMQERYGDPSEIMRARGSKGGSVKGTTGGFAADSARARTAGATGGKYSRKGYKLIERTETSGTYRRMSDGAIVEIKY